jgi:hypothetical protein
MDDVVTVDPAAAKRHQHRDMAEFEMADEPDDPDAAAARLEAALERIAARAAVRAPAPVIDPPDEALSVPEIADRLDQLIGRLRAALDAGPPSGAPASIPPGSE